MIDIYNGFYKGKKVLVTGHTGFKGSWLSIWLHELGAEVVGVGLEPYSEKDNFVLSGIGKKIKSDIRADIRDGDNVMGTINIMEAIRATESVKVGVMITTDKCYDNKEQMRGYKEDDPFGGYDPYSSSKGACEIAIQSWRRSFFNPEDYGKKHHVSLASVRAGNVIGGGDWAKDRIIPDCIRALEAGKPIDIRSPKAVRPWEHVLEPLSGYMLLAQKMWEHPTEYCEGWNFGPEQESVLTVWEVASAMIENFGYGELRDVSDPNALHEANLLLLNIEKVKSRIGWKPKMNAKQCAILTSDWYKRYQSEDVYKVCIDEIEKFVMI